MNSSCGRVSVVTSLQSRIAYRNRHFTRIRSHDDDSRRPGGFKDGSRKPKLANLYDSKAEHLSFSQRTQLVDKTGFPSWLEMHIRMLVTRFENGTAAQKPEDEGFTIFLRNLIPVLKSDSTQRMLNEKRIIKPVRQTDWQPTEHSRPLSLFAALKKAFAVNGKEGVDAQLKYSYNGLLAGRSFKKVDLEDQARLADLRYPAEWYPATREVQRTIHLHVGPTNSGKTHHALKRLEQARTGLYAGPLRLLAHEVYTRLNAKGKACDLVTGDEQRHHTDADGPRMISCTVEMVPLNTLVDVAVIDEIQMIGDGERGWAWTQALLGLQAKELHLCGEARTVQLIRQLAALMGDRLEVHTYERLSPLRTMSTSLRGDLNNLRKGDCVVVFSRVGIHAMKSQVERITGKRVAIIYGSLPPEVRAQQAALFNDPDNDYDILVASDAIGMGLNLAIKRIVFETVTKFNGSSTESIHPSQIKQIAGRAGRFRTAPQHHLPGKPSPSDESPVAQALLDLPAPPSNLGLVTTMEAEELPFVREAMQTEADPIMTAGLLPPTSILDNFARYFPPSISFSYILLRLQELSALSPCFHLCQLRSQVAIADVIQTVEGLSIHDRYLICSSPAQVRDHGMPQIVVAYARCIDQGTRGELLSIPELDLEVLDEEVRLDREYVRRLETLHKALVLYIWLSYRVAGVFLDQEMAFYVKKLTEQKIDAVLGDFSASPAVHKRIQALKMKALETVQKLNDAASQPEDQAEEEVDLETDENLAALLDKKPDDAEDQGPDFRIPEVNSVAGDRRRPPVSGSMTL